MALATHSLDGGRTINPSFASTGIFQLHNYNLHHGFQETHLHWNADHGLSGLLSISSTAEFTAEDHCDCDIYRPPVEHCSKCTVIVSG